MTGLNTNTTFKKPLHKAAKQEKDAKLDASKAETPGPSNIQKKTTVRVDSVEDVDLMSDEEIKVAKLSGIARAKVQKLVKQGEDYIKAKRSIIKGSFIRDARKGQGEAKAKQPQASKANKLREPVKAKRSGGSEKRPRSADDTPSPNQGAKRPKPKA